MKVKTVMDRRCVVLGLPLLLGACVARQGEPSLAAAPAVDPAYLAMYAAIDGEPYPVPAVDLSKIKPQYLRREVAYATSEAPGTIVVDPNARFLYLVRENGRALRYGVGVGKVEAFNFQGEATIARKAEWPRWTPTSDMIAREPERYGPVRAGLPGGPGNPLGPRALYLYRGGRDTLYRLHGTTEPHTIGTKVSSGCVRLLNQDIIDLYGRVPVGTRAVVLPSVETPVA
ncbi:L,D-transpeptidase [Labrys wisconsinensis]|uniref:Lipoprotein-anchoring transpeptidase ErfK/SrfK n=1 Tax=Labrys wisconsinensis TaxID=425677 RepID=A0ABU0JLD6_9HYPH|nr:L,D-transpeptidase [Labrys wisconsinensis]MDQ0474286.1 lipoprotein-anchoring transpeptidase ErfK/SrfK [Labrys wisconsinensis]